MSRAGPGLQPPGIPDKMAGPWRGVLKAMVFVSLTELGNTAGLRVVVPEGGEGLRR